MKYLYVNNFRGFTDTCIPLMDVNFLVGENSTGKTSVLSLLKNISSLNFWFNLNFETDDVKLGHFNDIVSIDSVDKRHFSFGIIDPESTEGFQSFLIVFSSRDGLPYVHRYFYYRDGKEHRVKFSKRYTYYKTNKTQDYSVYSEFHDTLFKEWKNIINLGNKISDRGYRKIPMNNVFGANNLVFLHTILTGYATIEEKGIKVENFKWPRIGPEITWLAPIRSKPQKTYDNYSSQYSSEGKHTPYLVKKLLESKRDKSEFLEYLNQFGIDSGLYESLSIKSYTRGATSPFELDVIINGRPISINSVGYGVSQSLPVVVELYHRPQGSWFAIQQPEVHLHPRAQAALGDIIYKLSGEEDKNFFIETHTDFMLDRFRMNFRKKKPNQPQSQILFFNRDGGANSVHSIPIDENGQLPESQPRAYRKFFIREQMKILDL